MHGMYIENHDGLLFQNKMDVSYFINIIQLSCVSPNSHSDIAGALRPHDLHLSQAPWAR